MIEVHGVTKTFGNVHALKNVSFQAPDNQVLGVIGLNGAGKSTLLRILATELTPSEGNITIDGFSIIQSPHEVRRRIGYLPDKPPIYPDMKVKDYLTFLAELRGVEKAKIRPYVQAACEKTKLTERLDFHLGSLSHGFQQRVSIAQAIVHQPPILILDEPTNGLDPLQIVELRDLVLSLKADHTILFSSHNLSEMTKICDHMLVIQHGEVLKTGRPEQLDHEHTMQIEVQWRGNADWSHVLQPIHGLKQKWIEQEDSGVHTGMFECQSDCRPIIAQKIIENKGELLALNKTQNELERVLMRLIGGNSN